MGTPSHRAGRRGGALHDGWSITTCLPDGRSRTPSVAAGTAMRPSTLRRYAEAAGFTRVDVLPIENDFFRFHRLRA